MRLIDADANIETMKKCAENPENEQALLCYRYAQRILEEAPTVPTASQWHRVEERLPDDLRDVIIFTASKIIGVGSFIRPNWYQWYSGGGIPVVVTYWMPIPEPPKEVQE